MAKKVVIQAIFLGKTFHKKTYVIVKFVTNSMSVLDLLNCTVTI